MIVVQQLQITIYIEVHIQGVGQKLIQLQEEILMMISLLKLVKHIIIM